MEVGNFQLRWSLAWSFWLLCCCWPATGAEPLWTKLNPRQEGSAFFLLNEARLQEIFQTGGSPKTTVNIPCLDGSFENFLISPSDILPGELAAKFPHIKSFRGHAVGNCNALLSLDINSSGLHAMIFGGKGCWSIEPMTKMGRAVYRVEARGAVPSEFLCLTEAAPNMDLAGAGIDAARRTTLSFRRYRIAVAAQGEYTQYFGGSAVTALEAITTTVNRISALYESELGISLQLVANEAAVIYTNPATDPYSFNDSSVTTINENQSNLDATIGSANYDVGIVFNTGKYGLAQIRSVCDNGRKGQAVIGAAIPEGIFFDLSLAAHEIGHQFGASHTFNSVSGECSGNRNSATAYEPGSGSTMMSYAAAACGPDQLQTASDPYFHLASIQEIQSYVSTLSCATMVNTQNNPPVVSAPPGKTIPRQTPFFLTASGTDPDGDTLTFCWEEFDLGPTQSLTNADNGSSPLFRSFMPTNSPLRFFPRMSDVLSNSITPGEKLPSTNRALHFQVTARDSLGGVGSAAVSINVDASKGPFQILSPHAGDEWAGLQNVSWGVAGTDASPIGVTNVNLFLSTNGGVSFSLLASNVPNSGLRQVTLPMLNISSARIKIEASGNIFFAMSGPFSITTRPQIQSVQIANTNLVLTWSAVNGRTYRLQFKNDLSPVAWSDLSGDVIATGSTATKSDSFPAGPRRFYRVVLLP